MHEMAKRGMAFAVTTGGLLLAGTGVAAADAGATTSGGGLLSGNAVQIPALLGLNACGNVIGVLSATGTTGSTGCSIADPAPMAAAQTSGGGLLAGNAVQIPISVPVNLCGNQVQAAGVAASSANTGCAIDTTGSSASGTTMGTAASTGTASMGTASMGTVSNNTTSTSASGMSTGGSMAMSDTSGSGGLLSGNAVQIPIDVPVNACGDIVNVLGVVSDMGTTACGIPAPAPTASPSSSPSATPSASPSGSASAGAAPVTGQAPSIPGISLMQPLDPPMQGVADPIVLWPRPGTALQQHAVPAKVTCAVAPAASTEAMGGGTGGAAGTLGAAAAAFVSGSGLRALGRRQKRRH